MTETRHGNCPQYSFGQIRKLGFDATDSYTSGSYLVPNTVVYLFNNIEWLRSLHVATAVHFVMEEKELRSDMQVIS